MNNVLKLNRVTFRDTDRRAGDFTHPDPDVNSYRQSVWFHMENMDPDYQDPELFASLDPDDQAFKYEIVKTDVTLYSRHPKEALTHDKKLALLKHQCISFYDIWKKHAGGSEHVACLACNRDEVLMPHVADTVKLLSPSTQSIPVDKLEILDQYSYIFYGATQFLQLLFDTHSAHECHVFYDELGTSWAGAEELFLKWANS